MTNSTSQTFWRGVVLLCLVVVHSAAPIHLAKHSQQNQVDCPVCVIGHASALLDTTSVPVLPSGHARLTTPPISGISPAPIFFAFSSRAPPPSTS